MSDQDFIDFQQYFKEYQRQFGLDEYKVYFKHERLDGCFANLTVSQCDSIATVRLNSKLPPKDIPHRGIRQSAKHEALHLLLFRLEDRALDRYIREGELYEIIEGLVFKLENLVRD